MNRRLLLLCCIALSITAVAMDTYNYQLDSSELIASHFNNPEALKTTWIRTTKALFQKLLNNADNTKFKELHELADNCETPVIEFLQNIAHQCLNYLHLLHGMVKFFIKSGIKYCLITGRMA